MPDSDYRRAVAGRFVQAARNKTFDLTHRLFPETASEITEQADRKVEDEGLHREGIEVILRWFRSDADAQWLDQFWQSPEGSRFLELSVELMTRAMFRLHRPDVPISPPSEI